MQECAPRDGATNVAERRAQAVAATARDADPPAPRDDAGGRTRPLTNAAYLVAANLGGRVLTLLLVLYTTRRLDTLYGNYVAVINFVGLFSVVTDLGLSTIAVRDVVQDRSLAVRYISNTLPLRLLLTLLDIVLIVALAQRLIQPDLRDALYVYALSLIPLTVSGTLQLAFQFAERQAPGAILSIGTTLLRVVLGFAVLYTGHHVLALTIVYTLVAIVGAVATAWIVYTRFLPLRMEFDLSWWPVLLRRAAPFAVLLLLNYVYASVDMQILYNLSGCQNLPAGTACKPVAQYGVAYQGLNVVTAIFTTAIGAAILPAINRVATESHAALGRMVRSAYTLMVVCAIPIALFTTFYAPEAVHVLAGRHNAANFAAAAPALAILMWDVPCFLVVNMLGTALLAVHRQTTLIVSFAVTLVFNVAFNLWLIPHYSYMASSVLTVASEFVNGAIILWALRRAIGPLRLQATTMKAAAMTAATAAVLWALHPFGIVVSLPIGVVVALLSVRAARVFGVTEREVLGRLPLVGRYVGLL